MGAHLVKQLLTQSHSNMERTPGSFQPSPSWAISGLDWVAWGIILSAGGSRLQNLCGQGTVWLFSLRTDLVASGVCCPAPVCQQCGWLYKEMCLIGVGRWKSPQKTLLWGYITLQICEMPIHSEGLSEWEKSSCTRLHWKSCAHWLHTDWYLKS